MKVLPIILFCFLIAGCNTATDTNKAAEATSIKKDQSNTEEKFNVPVYDYAGLAPIFNQKSDTTYVINFWATWCKPCVAELPYFVELHKNYESKKFKLIFVSLDFPKQIEKKLIPFLKKNNLPGEMMLLNDNDMNSWIPKVDKEWSGAIPATIVYNQNKRAFYEKSFHNYTELDEIIQPFFR